MPTYIHAYINILYKNYVNAIACKKLYFCTHVLYICIPENLLVHTLHATSNKIQNRNVVYSALLKKISIFMHSKSSCYGNNTNIIIWNVLQFTSECKFSQKWIWESIRLIYHNISCDPVLVERCHQIYQRAFSLVKKRCTTLPSLRIERINHLPDIYSWLGRVGVTFIN